MNVQAALEADAQFAEADKPHMGSLHQSAMLTQTLAAFDTSAGNPTCYAAIAQM